MNEKTLNFINEMKKQTIGIEIEMAGITREKACRVIASHFGTERTVRHDGGGYDVWSCLDNQGRRWNITRDGSIRANSDLEKTELGTPILHYDDIEDLQEIARKLRRAGAISNPLHGCGVHCHIGANGHDAKTLRNLANIMASHESLLTSALSIDRGRITSYCQTVNQDFLKKLNKRKPQTMAALADLWYAGDYGSRTAHYNHTRYHMLNLHATFTKGTVDYSLY